jgi:hypothetical protein
VFAAEAMATTKEQVGALENIGSLHYVVSMTLDFSAMWFISRRDC